MRNIVIIVIYSVLLLSCFPENCFEYVIENKTDKDLEVISFLGGVMNKNRKISVNSGFSEKKSCSKQWGEDLTGKKDLYYIEDSIQIKSNGILLKTYYPEDEEKSIFNTGILFRGEGKPYSWKVSESRADYRRYVFEITEEDLR